MRILLAATVLLLVMGCASSEDELPAVAPPSGARAGLFISPMGEPFRAASPGADVVGAWVRAADANGDGSLSREEMEQDAARFFRTLDTDGDGEITPPEMVRYEQQVAPEIQLGRQMGTGRGRRGGPGGFESQGGSRAEDAPPAQGEERGERRRPDRQNGPRLPEGASRYALLDLPQPVAAADADFNRAVTAAEFRDAAAERFALLDRDHDERITRQELEPPPPPPKQKK